MVLEMARSTVAAVLACPCVTEVLVVTGDALVRSSLGPVAFVDDPGGGLNAALRHAAAVAPPSQGVAALTADIPALRPSELAQALSQCKVRSFVPDLPGTGTVMLAAPYGVPLDPRFGPGSAAAHEASGAVRLDGAWPTLRRDVDTADDLAAAYALGWNPAQDYSGAMQGTVSEFDPDRRSGVVLLDDGSQVRFTAAAFDAGGLRLLRLGQRLRLERDAEGIVTRVTIPTMT
jgi:2-phospho-L-lactate guanylyltransferase